MRFDTELTVTGPLRAPAQMLADQEVDGHASVHDGETAASLGLARRADRRARPTSASSTRWRWRSGARRGSSGAASAAHFRTMVVEGEEVQASMTTTGPTSARIEAHKADGTPVLTGTASIGPDHRETELDARRAAQGDPGRAVHRRPARGRA